MTDTVCVPVEPTLAMILAATENCSPVGCCSLEPDHAREIWEAMLAASPQGEGSSGEAELSQARSNAMSADHIPDAGNMIEPVEAVAWRDIATAPRDGTMLLVGYDEGVAREGAMEDRQRVFEARWNDVQGTWSARNGFLLHSDATHWQPLPHPPSAHPAPIKPSGDTGELRERMKRAIWTQLPQEDANMGTSGRIADAILDIIRKD